MPTWREALQVTMQLLRLDRSAVNTVLARDEWTRLCLALFVAEQAAFRLWEPSLRFYLARLIIMGGMMLGIHLVARHSTGESNLPAIFRLCSLIWVVDLLGVLGPAGTILAGIGNLWCVVALVAALEEQFGLIGRHALRLVAGGLGIGLITAMTVDTGVRHAQAAIQDYRQAPDSEPVDEPLVAAPAPSPPPPAPTPPPTTPPEPAADDGADGLGDQRRVLTVLVGSWELDARATLAANPDPRLHKELQQNILPMMKELTQRYAEDGTLLLEGRGMAESGSWKVMRVEDQTITLQVAFGDEEPVESVVEVLDGSTLRIDQGDLRLILGKRPNSAPLSYAELQYSRAFENLTSNRGRNQPGRPRTEDVLVRHSNGQLALQATRVNGRYEGSYTRYHFNGRIAETGLYLNGQRQGRWVSFDDQGNRRYEVTYQDGRVVHQQAAGRSFAPQALDLVRHKNQR